MSELRQNIISSDWVIIAKDRARRPQQFVSSASASSPVPRHDPSCPFCPGNERETEQESFRIARQGAWQVRVVANKYSAFTPAGTKTRAVNGLFRSMSGVGIHDVVIEHPRHDLTMAQFSAEEVCDVLRAYRVRFLAIAEDPRIESIIIFRNHGEAAGTSLIHPHSQIAAMPVVPRQLRSRLEEAVRFYDSAGECVFCRTLAEELQAGVRIVHESPHHVAFIPFAALSPFHLWIYPRRHSSFFAGMNDDELDDLGRMLRVVLRKLFLGLGNPPYNFSIRSNPVRERDNEYFHWYLTIVPRVSRTAGFEIGSGMFINASLPEESATFLRDVNPETEAL